ncbi:platelet-activating factor acetylhydrolase 2, cytoplasmic-like isoform X1 [Varroa destructor]|uniref:1-alkyl-2-acetylglycerophosphocholine esterase n=1 Tax=Varroa destructor TaxID=109461 RepID=A0A7M7J351_VARDE|nr:platelet-activating factor acetylhydrolase 2, cytoplasmic-like isoform X1 [Varroa destructor]XP_022646156.1 platelet-activating factor acetylhydrolase 2, cytoplasmic-like isoform X1 [Varroa destructor]XP_022646157.1 platelet-activating factor acetylhydrolase 2, cytoplasmic-like isoform X1 [Varroa destructor]XP_022646158.1 platelet-activating factor acetylhydrolase 2, cytoplasmic-like isoform X1 [Varroa destructor]XP_022646160.1 platelet-activating factor acetylhydrolase 2, cytoplasmic-like i
MEDGERDRDKTLSTEGINHLPLPRGRYKVGSVDMLNGVTRDRGVLFRIFYPCDERSHIVEDVDRRTTWLPQPEKKYSDGYAKVHGNLTYFTHKILGKQTASLYVPATTNGRPVRENRNAFPLVLFSHDIGECRTTSSSLCIELASHGCVVAAVEHRDNTACRTFYVERVTVSASCNADGEEEVDTVDGEKSPNNQTWDEDREETDEPLRGEEEVPMCESTLDDDEDESDCGDSVQGEQISTKDGQLNESADETDTSAKFRTKTFGQSRTVWVNYRSIEKSPSLYNIRLRQLHRRVAELIRTLNCLEKINARKACRNELPDNCSAALAGIMDLNRVTIVGRGFGGATAYMTLQMEERTLCGAAIDPLMFVIQTDRPINVCRPLLLVLNSRHTAREDVRIIKTMFRKTYTTAYTLLGSASDAQSDLPFVRQPSLWSSLSLSWPMVAPGSFTSLDLGSSLLLRFMADKCNFCTTFMGPNREKYEDYVQRKSNLIEAGVKMPSRLFSRYTNAR